MKDRKLKIFVAYHKEPIFVEMKDIIPIQVGKKIYKKDFGIMGDDTGYNISDKNRDYAELTAQYWVRKNYNLSDTDYVGFCHYRRYFTYRYKYNFLDSIKIIYKESESIMDFFARLLYYFKRSLCTDKIKNIKKIEDNFLELKRYIESTNKNVYLSKSFFTFSLRQLGIKNNKIRKIFEKSLLSLYPDYKPDLSSLDSLHRFNRFNMFIMNFKTFKQYAEWQFNVLFEFENNIKKEGLYEILLKEHIVVFGFKPYAYISEFMINLWLIHNKDLKISRDLSITFYG